MYSTDEVLEDIVAQRFDDDGNLLEKVIIPKGTTITIIDIGDCAEVLEPEEYKGLMFVDGYESTDDDED